MPNYTKNHKLKKPLGTESALIKVLNENFDAIDGILTPEVSDATAPTKDSKSGVLGTVIGWLAYCIKAITGKTYWYEKPTVTLEDISKHMNADGTHSNATQKEAGFMSGNDKLKLDSATSDCTGNLLMKRDDNGRVKVASPTNPLHAVNKEYADGTFVSKKSSTVMEAKLVAQNNEDYGIRQVRNIVLWTSGDTPPTTSNGDIVIKTF